MCTSTEYKRNMSAVDYSAHRDAVIWLEEREAKKLGVKIEHARKALARAMRLAPGTLLDIRKGRLKSLRGNVERAIDAQLITTLKKEIERLEHELEMAEARGVATDRREIEGLVGRRDALAALLNEAPPK